MTYTEVSTLIMNCYLTGNFEPMLEIMTDDYKHHSFWVLDPIEGREELEKYYRGKGRAIAASDSYRAGRLVMISDPRKVRGADITLPNGETIQRATFMIWADFGKVCALLAQETDGEIVQCLAIPKLTEDGRLSELCITEPKLYNLLRVPEDAQEEL